MKDQLEETADAAAVMESIQIERLRAFVSLGNATLRS
jgi:hypothetical protein